MKKLTLVATALTMMFAVACEKTSIKDMQPSDQIITNDVSKIAPPVAPVIVSPGEKTVSAFYNGEYFTIRYKEFTGIKAQDLLLRYQKPRTMFESEGIMSRGVTYKFMPVLDKVFNVEPGTVFVVKKVTFDLQITKPYQFQSSEEIRQKASTHGSGISFQTTDRIALVTVIFRQPSGEIVE
jgi:hypothetical protein